MRFLRMSGDEDGVIFTSRHCGCCSEVGHKTDSNIQAISVGPGCDEVGTIAHEIGHALGFYHEMSRPDRNTAVTILWENIHPENRKNFKIEPDIETFGLPYDPYSIMHYGAYDFTWNNQPVMEFRPELLIDIQNVGHRKTLSFIDEWRIKSMYNCKSCGRSVFLNRRTVLTEEDIRVEESYCQFGIIASNGLKIKINILTELTDGWLQIYDWCSQIHISKVL